MNNRLRVAMVSYIFRKAIFLIIMAVSSSLIKGQESKEWETIYDSIKSNLSTLENSVPGLNQKINISITDATLNEFLRAIAKSSGINMNISPELTQKVVNNFSDVNISDVLLFLCNQYRLDLTSLGNIISIKQFNEPTVSPVCVIAYNDSTRKLTVETEGEELGNLAKKLTLASRMNVIPAPGLNSQKISAFVLSLPFEETLDKIAYSNNLVLKSSDTNVFLFEKKIDKVDPSIQKNDINNLPLKAEKGGSSNLIVKVLGKDSLSIYADKVPVLDVIKEISNKTGNNYIITSSLKGEINTQLSGVSFFEAMITILSGSGLVCKKSGRIYMIGTKETSDLMTQSMIELQYRSVDSIMSLFPKDVLSDLQTIEYKEQNSLLLSGSSKKVMEAEKFIREIDKRVPVISIEVLIIDYTNKNTVSTGIEAGIGNAPTEQSTGTVFPSTDIVLNSSSINNLISRFNGFGWAKIGKVTPNFYLSLKALETQGLVKIRSTPILSTLNGHKAEMSIGETAYYVEEQSNIVGSINTQTVTSQIYKSVSADLVVKITPQVSGDDQITLKIEVEQSDFTARISTTAPPGEVTRKFKSQIRVKDGEMILLGGLEENRKDKSTSGTPFLSRIPLIKWLFSSRDESTTKTKLNIFIKPTILN
jgi:type IV pilus assembly protein PilQ